jgi:hypothetical protein
MGTDPPSGALKRLLAKFTAIIKWIRQQPFETLAAIIGIVVAVWGTAFWLCLVIVAALSLFIVVRLWCRFPVVARFPTTSRSLWALLVITFPAAILWTKYLKENPSPSLVYIVPGFWSPSPIARWFMMIQHCGPDPLFNVQIIFDDGDRKDRISTQNTTTPSEMRRAT